MKTCYKRLKNLFRREPSFRNPYVYLKEEAIAETQKKKKNGSGKTLNECFDMSSLSLNESFFSATNTKKSFKLKKLSRNKVESNFKSKRLRKKKSFTESIRTVYDRLKGTDISDTSLLDISFKEDTQPAPETSSPILSSDRLIPKRQENEPNFCASYLGSVNSECDFPFAPYDVRKNQVVDVKMEKAFGVKQDNSIAKERQRAYNLGDDKSDKSDNTEIFSSPESPSHSNFRSVYSEGSELSTNYNPGVVGQQGKTIGCKSCKLGNWSGCKKSESKLVEENAKDLQKGGFGDTRNKYERFRPISCLVHIYHPNGSFILPKGTTDTPEILEFRKIYHECYEKNIRLFSRSNKEIYASLSNYDLRN